MRRPAEIAFGPDVQGDAPLTRLATDHARGRTFLESDELAQLDDHAVRSNDREPLEVFGSDPPVVGIAHDSLDALRAVESASNLQPLEGGLHRLDDLVPRNRHPAERIV